MSQRFTYSILQYKHSQILNETVNIGILFFFPESKDFYFTKGDTSRVKCIYQDIDSTLIDRALSSIYKKVEANKEFDTNSLFRSDLFPKDFSNKLTELLIPDSSSIQFSKPYTAALNYTEYKSVAQKFSDLLLPKIDKNLDHSTLREPYIIKRFVEKIKSRNIVVDAHLRRDHVVRDQGVEVKFDVSWKNGATHLLRPISFDLKKREEITIKSANNFGRLTLLGDAAKFYDYTFDLLLIKPRNEQFLEAYDDAKKILNKINAPKSIIEEENVDAYADEAANTLIAEQNT